MLRNDPILKNAQRELERHQWGNFSEGDERTIAQGGRGVIVVGCMACKLRLNTIPQFMLHLSEDVLPQILDQVLERAGMQDG
jgi:primosomal replication protein N